MNARGVIQLDFACKRCVHHRGPCGLTKPTRNSGPGVAGRGVARLKHAAL